MRLFAFTPYADTDETFAQAIQRHMDLLGPEDAAVIMDHDILHTTRDWYPRIVKHISEGVEFGTCLTNRLYSGFQIDPDAPKFNADEAHWQHGHDRAKRFDGKRTDHSDSIGLMSGHLVVISKKVWDAIQPLEIDSIVGLDNEMHTKAVAAGFKLWLLEDVYVYHRYRFGDRNATEHLEKVPVPKSIEEKPTEKPLKTSSNEPIRKVCYTVITGNYDTLKNPNTVTPGWEYHLYTDNPQHFESMVGPWQVFDIEAKEGEDARALQRRVKLICPIKPKKGQLLRTVYVDGNQQVVGNLDKFVEGLKHPWGGFTIKKHPERNCAYKEADACLELRKDGKERIEKMVKFLKGKKFKKDQGMYETGIMVRDYNDPSGTGQLSRFMIKWEKMLRLYSFRDQISLPYVIENHKRVVPNVADAEKFSAYFSKTRHEKTGPQDVIGAGKTESAVKSAPSVMEVPKAAPLTNGTFSKPFSTDFELNVYTSAVGAQVNRIPWFVESVLRTNPDAHVEILVSDKQENLPDLDKYKEHAAYKRHEWLRNDANGHFGSYRYLIEPDVKTKYLFMPDIEEQVIANVLDAFLPRMEETGLPFSNTIRNSGVHMPSSHFTEYDAFFPHPFTPHIPAVRRTGPETLLLNIVRKQSGEPIETDRPNVTARIANAVSL